MVLAYGAVLNPREKRRKPATSICLSVLKGRHNLKNLVGIFCSIARSKQKKTSAQKSEAKKSERCHEMPGGLPEC